MSRGDIIASLVIGEASALLMLFVGRNVALPDKVTDYLYILPYVFPLFTAAVMVAGTVLARVLPFFRQLTKFGLVGGLNFLIDLGVLNLMIALTGITQGFFAGTFKAAAFLTAVISSFLWNKFWTFGVTSVENAGRQFLQFFLVTLVGFLINVGAFLLLNDYIGPRAAIDPKTWASVSAAGAAGVGLIWNFLGYKFLVFSKI
ncbi:MAG: GtrA family protein [Candidatus Sungbacteria bacterium]|nr:GtrA family protein [Candidatus Sungbacteria bacterium]